MSERKTLSEWLQFLLAAGIPASQAASYAVSFVENRIEKDMLTDLDKDYLKELGITVLGDIIAILKHAKKVSSQMNKPSEIQIRKTPAGIKKSTPASRMLESVLKSEEKSRDSPCESENQEEGNSEDVSDEEEDVYLPTSAKIMRKSKLRSDRVASSPSHKSVTAAVTKTKSTISHQRKVAPPRSKVVHKEEVPVPKSRRVLPEHEGKYKITMPSGSTPKTARLLAEGKLSSSQSKLVKDSSGQKVFYRLGSSKHSDVQKRTGRPESSEDAVASLTKANIISSQKNRGDNSISFTVTGLGKINPQHIINTYSSNEKGVFNRLGGSASLKTRRPIKRPATSTQPDESEPAMVGAAPYIGVLKDGGIHAESPKKLRLATSTGDRSGFATSRLVTENAKLRLGQPKTGSSVKITRTISSSGGKSAGPSLKSRLGLTSDSLVSSSTDRLKSGKSTSAVMVATRTVKSASSATSADVFSRLGNRN